MRRFRRAEMGHRHSGLKEEHSKGVGLALTGDPERNNDSGLSGTWGRVEEQCGVRLQRGWRDPGRLRLA